LSVAPHMGFASFCIVDSLAHLSPLVSFRFTCLIILAHQVSSCASVSFGGFIRPFSHRLMVVNHFELPGQILLADMKSPSDCFNQ
jgi:hypothetical protein